jgi:hypothetical protein
MRATPYALSVHHFISTVGADAGFAAIIGLAIVVLLFFAHARETANLRQRATEAEDALHRLEQYVDQIARSGAVRTAEPAPAPASAASAPGTASAPVAMPARAGTGGVGGFGTGRTVTPAPAPVGVLAGAPGAPAGVGAPALSAATRLIPAADEGTIAIRSNLPAAAKVGSATGATAAVMDPPGPPPSTSAGGANGNRVPPAPPPASAGQTMGGRERLPQRPVPARPLSASDQRRRGQRAGGSRIGRGAIVLAVALVVVVGVGAALVLTNSSGGGAGKTTAANHAARTTRATSTHASKSTAAGAVTPATVTVSVLNGTSTTNLAHDISQKLQSAGYKPGNIATATDQTQSSTTVGYLPSYKRDAQAVAKSLKLAPGSVQAVDPNNRTVACSGSATSCSAQVVVTVGTDLASHA